MFFVPSVTVNGTIFSNVTKTLSGQKVNVKRSKKGSQTPPAPPPPPTRTTDSTLPVDLSSVNHEKVPHINNACALSSAGVSVFFLDLKYTHTHPHLILNHRSLSFSGTLIVTQTTRLQKVRNISKDQQRF